MMEKDMGLDLSKYAAKDIAKTVITEYEDTKCYDKNYANTRTYQFVILVI